MTRKLVRLGGGNTPRHTVNKPRIVPPRDQALLVAQALRRRHIDLGGLAEAHTDLVRALRRDPAYGVVRAQANDVFPRTRIGNATVVRDQGPNGWDRLDRYDQTVGEGSDALHLGWCLHARRSDGLQVTTNAGHLWSRPAASDHEWGKAAFEVRDVAEEVQGPLDLVFDWNRGRQIVAKVFPARAGYTVTGAGVTLHVTRGLDVRRMHQDKTLWPTATDHREGLVTITAAATDTRRQDRLPR